MSVYRCVGIERFTVPRLHCIVALHELQFLLYFFTFYCFDAYSRKGYTEKTSLMDRVLTTME